MYSALAVLLCGHYNWAGEDMLNTCLTDTSWLYVHWQDTNLQSCANEWCTLNFEVTAAGHYQQCVRQQGLLHC